MSTPVRSAQEISPFISRQEISPFISAQIILSHECNNCEEWYPCDGKESCQVHKVAVAKELDHYCKTPLQKEHEIAVTLWRDSFYDCEKLTALQKEHEIAAKLWRDSLHGCEKFTTKTHAYPPAEAMLAAMLNSFGKNCSDSQYVETAKAVLDHGRMDINFRVSDLLPHTLPIFFWIKHFSIILPHRSPYFSMGAIFSHCRDDLDDKFCVLFENGKYFYCEDVGRCIIGTEQNSYRAKLVYLKRFLETYNIKQTMPVNKRRKRAKEI